MNPSSQTKISPQAAHILKMDARDLPQFLRLSLEEHGRVLQRNGQQVLKDAPETAITIVNLPGRPAVCVKEFRWRGLLHAAKGLLRPSQGLRTFLNGQRLVEAGIGTANPLALVRDKRLGLVKTEWVVMEVIPDSLELDRYILKRIEQPWRTEGRRGFVRKFGRFLGVMHSKGIFHSDLKTCNVLVSERKPSTNDSSETASDGPIGFHLLDYDDVSHGREVSDNRRIKNLIQIFLSTPVAVGATDRMRFLREYAFHGGLNRRRMRRIASEVVRAARGKDILYVGFNGDVTETWDRRDSSSG